jgi:uncharacterized membrane protein (UPF0127 family)
MPSPSWRGAGVDPFFSKSYSEREEGRGMVCLAQSFQMVERGWRVRRFLARGAGRIFRIERDAKKRPRHGGFAGPFIL